MDEAESKFEEERSTGSSMELRKVRKITAKKRILDKRSTGKEALESSTKVKKMGLLKKKKKKRKKKVTEKEKTDEPATQKGDPDMKEKSDEERKDDEEQDQGSDNNAMTLEMFTDIVLASEGLTVNKNKEQQQQQQKKPIKGELKKPVVLEPVAVKEENNNDNKTSEVVANLIQNNNDLIVEVKPMKPKPVVLSPRQPPGSHLLPHHQQKDGKVSLNSSVVVSVKPRVQPKPAMLPPQNKPPKTPHLVEEWLSKIQTPALSNIVSISKTTSEALNLSTKISASRASITSKTTPIYLKPISTLAARTSSNDSAKEAPAPITVTPKLWPPGHPKHKALMALDKMAKSSNVTPPSQYSPPPAKRVRQCSISSPGSNKQAAGPTARLSPPRLEITKVDNGPPGKKIGRALPFNEKSVHMENVKARALRDVQLAHTKDMHGNYPIHMSVLMRKTDLVKRYCCILQVLESTMDLLNEDKMTPLHLAIRDQSLDIIEILLGFGANPMVRDKRGNSSLHMAAASKSVEMVELLLRCVGPTDLNTTNDFGLTPIHIARMGGDVATVEILAKRGAEVSKQIPESLHGMNSNIALSKQQNLNLIIAHIPKKTHVEIPSR